jgi:hypothetical protein
VAQEENQMPAKTYRLGAQVDAECVAALLFVLLGDPDGGDLEPGAKTLAELGADANALADLWAAVCEEFDELSPGPELDPDLVRPDMTVAAVAVAMVRLLGGGNDGR